MSYHACGICRREFMDDDEYRSHQCFVNGRIPADIISSGKIDDMPMGAAINAGGNAAIMRMAKEARKKNGGDTVTSDNSDELSEASLERVDARLSAAKELISMKKVLAKAGIQAGTLNEADTRAEYDKLMKSQETEQISQKTVKTRKQQE